MHKFQSFVQKARADKLAVFVSFLHINPRSHAIGALCAGTIPLKIVREL